MGSGAPDWTHRNVVDIKTQSLESITVDVHTQSVPAVIIRSVYGGWICSAFSDSLPPITPVAIVDIAGDGIIYGGYLFVQGYMEHYEDAIWFYLDGAYLGGTSWYGLDYYTRGDHHAEIMCIDKYDNDNYIYSAVFAAGVVFKESFCVEYFSQSSIDEDAWCECKLYYAIT